MEGLINMLVRVNWREGEGFTLILLTWTKWWAHASASKWQMRFNSAFKVLMSQWLTHFPLVQTPIL